jgi:NAD(P)-dependent dehydrogenase (short-subunit alcohol dehydrogenase family)
VVDSRNPDAGARVAASITADGFSASHVQLDVTSDESITAAVGFVEKTYGRLDVLINNAAILLDLFETDISTRDLFTRTFATNVIGTACLTEACLPLLRKSNLPKIVFVSSDMGSLAWATKRDMPYFNLDIKAYDSSKAAVNMLALNYARLLEDKEGLVNVVCPGLVTTKLTQNDPEGATPEVGAQRILELTILEKGGG